MIFYFTGTGNSLDAAKRILEEDEKLYNITSCIKEEKYSFELKKDEKLGFVFPVYFYNIPKIVKDFIANLNIKNVTYTYAIITCGGGIMQSANVLKKELNKRNINLNYASELLMPDNAVIYYGIDSKENNLKVLQSSYEKLKKIKNDIDAKKESKFSGTFISTIVGSMYNVSLSTKKFYVENEKCISCKKCELNCPIEAIKLIDGKPVWIKNNCIKCLACINRCPKNAIQYGKLTKKRHRYENPNI